MQLLVVFIIRRILPIEINCLESFIDQGCKGILAIEMPHRKETGSLICILEAGKKVAGKTAGQGMVRSYV